MNNARKAGYQIVIVHVHVDLETAIERNNSRSKKDPKRIKIGANIISKIDMGIKQPLDKPNKYQGKRNFEVLYSLADMVFYVDNSTT